MYKEDYKIKQEVRIEREVASLLTIAAAHIYCFLPEGFLHICVKDFHQNVKRAVYVPFIYKKMKVEVY